MKKWYKISYFFCFVFSSTQLFSVKNHKKKLPCISSSSSQSITCPIPSCKKKTFISEVRLKQHEYNVHGPGSILVTCPISGCNKEVRRYTLNDHKRYTHGPKIECTKCGVTFTKHTMYKHLQRVHGEKYRYTEPVEPTKSISPIDQSSSTQSSAPIESGSSTIQALEAISPPEPRSLLLQALRTYQKPAILDLEYEPGTEENQRYFENLTFLTKLLYPEESY